MPEKKSENNTNIELNLILQKLQGAENPEEIFGSLDGEDDKLNAARSIYRHLSKLTHPNLYYGKAEETTAEAAFKKLYQLWEETQVKLAHGTYGQIKESPTDQKVTVHSKKREYEIQEPVYPQGLANLYCCTYLEKGLSQKAIFKITHNPEDNDLMVNEAQVLKHLLNGEVAEKFHWYVPALIDSFNYIDKSNPRARQVNVFSQGGEFYSLKEVKEAYPGGINPKDMAWIFRRLLAGLGYAHLNDVIHGAILPPNVFIYPEKHGLFIGEWSYAILDPDNLGEPLKAIDPEYENWYPPQVLRKERPLRALDICLGARCMIDLLGGNPLTKEIPDSVPKRIRLFFKGCLLPDLRQCPQNAWDLMDEFDTLIEDLWGPRRFHPFTMPKTGQRSPFR